MNRVRIAGAILLIAGILALVYGGFTYTAETHDATIGPVELEIEDKERVDVPVWLGVIATVAGAGLFLYGRGKRVR